MCNIKEGIKIKLKFFFILHIVHASEKRMIASRVDALSRGDTTNGIIKGNSLLTYFPFDLGADQRSRALVPWINSWWTGKK